MKRRPKLGRIHCVIPDVQVKPGVPTEHLSWIGNYIAEKRPDVIVQIGDFNDMASLSFYALGKAEGEGTRYTADIEAGKAAMKRLVKPFRSIRGYKPSMHLTLGNHEDRIDREAQSQPRLIGKLSTKDLGYAEFGWTVHPFLKVIRIDGIEYTHYFTSGPKGRPVSSAAAILRERHSSGIMGHNQFTDIAIHKKSGHIGMMVGCAYLHDEEYLGAQGNCYRRQIVMLHEVRDGIFDPMLVSLAFLKAKYS